MTKVAGLIKEMRLESPGFLFPVLQGYMFFQGVTTSILLETGEELKTEHFVTLQQFPWQ